MLIRTHLGVSLDGFVATSDGLPAWDALPTFGPGTHGTAALAEHCAAVVMGRTSFNQGFRDWLGDWPWPGTPLHVLTARPLPPEAAALHVVAAASGPAELLARVRAADLAGDVYLHGGSRTIQAFLAPGAIDRLGLVVLPLLLGAGIPLFPLEIAAFSRDAWATLREVPAGSAPTEAPPRPLLRLDRQRAFPDGAIELVYAPA